MIKLMYLKNIKVLLLSILVTLSSVSYAYALPPPDVIIQVASNLASYIAIFIALSISMFSVGYTFLKDFYRKYRYILLFGVTVFIFSGMYFIETLNKDNIVIVPIENGVEELSQWMLEDSDIEIMNQGIEYNISGEILYGNTEIVTSTGTTTEKEPMNHLKRWLQEDVTLDTSYLDTIIPDKDLKVPKKEISNEELTEALTSERDDYILLDARENIEFELGKVPGSIHIRPADLKDENKWEELPTDKYIYVLCWSGMRGEIIANFLESKGLHVRFLEGGLESWTDSGGIFEGQINMSSKYFSIQHSLFFNSYEIPKKVEEGVKLIDAREPYKIQDTGSILGAENFSVMYTGSDKLNTLYKKFIPGDSIIVLCDAYINCFDATLVGIELEKRGLNYLGRFYDPVRFLNIK